MRAYTSSSNTRKCGQRAPNRPTPATLTSDQLPTHRSFHYWDQCRAWKRLPMLSSIDLFHVSTVRSRSGSNCPNVASIPSHDTTLESRHLDTVSSSTRTSPLETGLPVRCGSYRRQRIRSLMTGMVRPDMAPTSPTLFVPRYSFRQYSTLSPFFLLDHTIEVSRNPQENLGTSTIVLDQSSSQEARAVSLEPCSRGIHTCAL